MVFKIFALIFLYCCIPRPLELNMLAKYTCFELVSFCVGYLKKKKEERKGISSSQTCFCGIKGIQRRSLFRKSAKHSASDIYERPAGTLSLTCGEVKWQLNREQ